MTCNGSLIGWHRIMWLNTDLWLVVSGVPVKKTDESQWWELFDQNTSRSVPDINSTNSSLNILPVIIKIIPIFDFIFFFTAWYVNENLTKIIEDWLSFAISKYPSQAIPIYSDKRIQHLPLLNSTLILLKFCKFK